MFLFELFCIILTGILFEGLSKNILNYNEKLPFINADTVNICVFL